MSDTPNDKPDAPAPAAEGQAAAADTKPESSANQDQTDEKSGADAPAANGSAAPAEESKPELNGKEEIKAEESKEESVKTTNESNGATSGDKVAENTTEGDSEMPDAGEASTLDADQSTADAASKKTPNRRKSTGGGNRKSLNKKASKAKITHLDAQPGDHFLVKLKGFPEWPAVICDESMLPHALLTSRPVTAIRPDGTYAEAYAEGGKRAADRSYPVMYLHTNEFGWVVNTALTSLTAEMAEKALGGKIRKDLKAAYELAVEQHPIDHYKGVLKKFHEEVLERQRAAEAAAATPKKGKKAKAVAGDEDVDMPDAGTGGKAKAKKRKAEDDVATPQRSDSVKKPKIKLNTSSTPKAANGATPQAKDSSTKTKTKKTGEKKESTKEKLTPEERLQRREKEVKFLRYKLQRGLLNKEHAPKDEEMKEMSDFITMLENLPDLEASIIRSTSIYKVLKQILKLKEIPRESEFNFKTRSQTLLEKYQKAMAADPASASTEAPTNGVSKSTEADGEKKEGAEKPADGGAAKEVDEKKPEASAEKAEVEAAA